MNTTILSLRGRTHLAALLVGAASAAVFWSTDSSRLATDDEISVVTGGVECAVGSFANQCPVEPSDCFSEDGTCEEADNGWYCPVQEEISSDIVLHCTMKEMGPEESGNDDCEPYTVHCIKRRQCEDGCVPDAQGILRCSTDETIPTYNDPSGDVDAVRPNTDRCPDLISHSGDDWYSQVASINGAGLFVPR